MGKLQEFEIILNNSKNNTDVYCPGESLSGTVNITTAQPLQCKEIKVNCNGYCGVTNKTNDTSWDVEEQYFNSTISLSDKGTLKQGDHSFSFKFLIPDSAPTSFEGNYGKILYRVRAFVDTPRFSKDYKTEKPFYLLRLLNLNDLPDIYGPRSSSITKQFTYLLVKTGTVELKATSDLRAYTPGQVIKLTTEIHNQSGKTTGTVVAGLMQKVTYMTKRPTHDVRTLAEVEGAGVKGGKQAKWKEQIIVPPLSQSSLVGCGIIDIEYFIQVTLKSPEAMLTLPIHIGNVSLDTRSRAPSRLVPSPPTPAMTLTPAPTATSALTPATTPAPTPSPRPLPRPAPRPAPRNRASSSSFASPRASPSAPPAEEGLASDALPTKSHSQLSASGPQAPVSPSAFSYAPGLTFSQNQPHSSATDSTAPLFCVSTGPTVPFFSEGSATAMPTSCPLILPPEYITSSYPHEAPPSYDDSCCGNT